MSNEQVAISEDSIRNDGKWATASRILEFIVGGVLLAAGLLKASDPLGFSQQIAAFKLVTDASAVKILAHAFIVIECIFGAALMAGYKRRLASIGTFALLLGFMAVLGWAWATGVTADCGCFGAWAKRTPGEAFLEDLLLVAGLGAAWMLNKRETVGRESFRLAAVAAATILGIAVTGFSANRPEQSNDATVRIQAKEHKLFESVKVSDLSNDVRKGVQLVALIDTGCDHCQESVPVLNQRFDKQGELPPLCAVCPNQPKDVEWFKGKFAPKFSIGRISMEDFLMLVERGSTPRLFLLKDGAVVKVWDEKIPSEDEIKKALSS